MIERQPPRRRDNGYDRQMQTARDTVHAQREEPKSRMNDLFHAFSRKTAVVMGRPWSFSIAIGVILLWGLSGPLFGFSDTWQLVINTATTIVTFLMVFLIQNTQNRDAKAIHLKLDELLRGVKGARNRLIDLENLSEDELNALQKEFERVRRRAPAEQCEEKEQQKE